MGLRSIRVRLPGFLRLGPLQRRLFLIAFVAMLPLVLLLSAALLYNARAQQDELLRAAVDTMQAVITAVDSAANESTAALEALTASSSLAAGDMRRFRAEAAELLARRPEWANVMLSDTSGAQVMNAALDVGSPSTGVASAPPDPADGPGEPSVGNIVFSPLLGLHGFDVRVPVREGARLRYVLTAAIEPDAIQQLLLSQAIPAGGVAAIFDRNDRVVARSRDYASRLGQHASPGMRELLARGETSGWGITRTLEDIEVYSVYYRSAATGWSAAVGIPVETLDAPLMRTYAVAATSVLLAALLGLLATFPVARTITAPMRELVEAAVQVESKGYPGVPRTRLPEVRKAFAALADAHREREQLLRSERQARLLEQEARRIAEGASREKDELLAMLGHELRNPLSAIASSAELLVQDPELSAAGVAEATGIIRRQVRTLAGMTERIVEASRAISGAIRLERGPADLGAVVDRAVEGLREADKLRRHCLVVRVDAAWVDGDTARLEQVVLNVLNNALKYTPPDGTIEVTVERVGDEALVRIRDDGAGIDAELLPRIFDPFVQGGRTLDRSEGGLGIGLTLVRRLVELHGGRVEVSSEGPGLGSEFTIRLPVIEPGRASADADPAPSGTASRSIVVVEDNDDVRASLRRLLERSGHRVHEARDGPAGVELIASERPEIAIVDIGLPMLDGFGVARAVRAAVGDGVRLVALTAYGSEQDVRRGMEAGFDDYLVKPFDPSVLSRLIETLGAGAPGSLSDLAGS